MSERETVRCCGRVMTVIAVDRPAHELSLHSCPSCGRHAWRQRGREVERSELLEVLRPVKEPAAVRSVPATPPVVVEDDQDRRTELQKLLSGFTVHGTTS